MDLKALIDDGTVRIEEVDPRPGRNERRLAVHVTSKGKTVCRYVNWPTIIGEYHGDLVKDAPRMLGMVRRNIDSFNDVDKDDAKRLLAGYAKPDRKLDPAKAIRACLENRVEQALIECNESLDLNLCVDCPDTGIYQELSITDSRTKEDSPNG